MKRSYDDEEFLPWYRRPSPTWLELTATERGILVSVAMELNQKNGQLTLRRGLPSLATLLRIPWEQVEPALARLIALKKLEWDGSRFVLSDPEYMDRKRPTSKERVKKHREAKASVVPDPADPVTAVTLVTLPTVGNVTSSLLCSDLISDLGSDLASPPDWWATTCDTVESVTGAQIDRGSAWLRYSGHRRDKGKRMAAPDAQYWLTTVDVREQKQDRLREQALRESAAASRNRRFEGPPRPPPPTDAQAKVFAENLSARLLGSRKVGT